MAQMEREYDSIHGKPKKDLIAALCERPSTFWRSELVWFRGIRQRLRSDGIERTSIQPRQTRRSIGPGVALLSGFP